MGKESSRLFGVIIIFMFANTTAAYYSIIPSAQPIAANSTVTPTAQFTAASYSGTPSAQSNAANYSKTPSAQRTVSLFCRDSAGKIHQAGELWQPDRINECACSPQFLITCSAIRCLDQDNGPREPGEEWLSNSTTKCSCYYSLLIQCEMLDEPECMDTSGTFRKSMETWMINFCVKCACVNGSINCSTYDVNITYGLFEVNVSPTCEHLVILEQTTSEKLSACQAFFRIIEKKNLIECASQGFYIKNAHRCNGISECPDGSDEQGCEDVKCSYRDDEGGTLLIPQHGWHVTPCLVCHCIAGLTSCKRTLEVNFPAYFKGADQLEETCTQPSCNVLRFIKDKKDVCEGAEVIKDGGIVMKGQTWNSSGCSFYFDGAILEKSGPVCPPMARAACYVYNGAICCATECPALTEIADQIRGDARICASGHQLISKERQCPNSDSQCLRAPNLQNCTSDITCQDEDSNSYFEGVAWSVGDCIKCTCKGGRIYCSRESSVLTSVRETTIDHCNQTQCDVARFLEKNKGICHACRWNGKRYFEGDSWKENGVDFYCSSSKQNVRPGCYVERNRVSCTGAIKGIRNLSLISKEKLFLCESGDEIRSFNDRCNNTYVRLGCDDQSDERNCDHDHYYCEAETKFGIPWPRTVIGQRLTKQCSLVDPAWKGTVSAYCVKQEREAYWADKKKCDCENRRLVEFFIHKISAVNESNFIDILNKLSDSKGRFTNALIFYEMLRDLFHTVKRLLTPITSNNSDQALEMCKRVIDMARNASLINKQNGVCKHKLEEDSDILSKQALEFLRLAPLNTTAHHYGSTTKLFPPNELQKVVSRNFVDPLVTITSQISRTRMRLMLTHQEEPVTSRLDLNDISIININNMTGNNTASIKIQRERNNTTNELTNQQIMKALEAKNCSEISYDKEKDVFVINNPSVSKTKLKSYKIQEYLELVLLCISTAAVTVTLTLLSILRIKLCERIFVHKSLLLSLGLGNLVYILDIMLFTKRKEHPALCSTVVVIEHFLHTAVFTWMLVEGINLYIKVVKVFSVNRQYVMYATIGWGIPAVIVGLVAAIKPSTFDMGKTFYKDVMCGSLKFTEEIERTRCWINGSLWIYKGPVLAILLVNLVLFVILLRVIYGQIATKYGENKLKVARRGLRSTMALLPLLGVTWLLGFVMHFHDALKYVFILLTSTQGVIFCIFQCVFDDQVRDALRSLRNKKRSAAVTERKSRVKSSKVLEDSESSKTIKVTSTIQQIDCKSTIQH